MHDYGTEAEARGEVPTLEGFLERVTLQADTDTLEDVEKVTLMTVHGAKGLEFELVLLTGMEEDMFPYRNQEPRSVEEMDEERRLAYVAITRARKHLVVTHVKQRQIFGTTRLGVPSRFVGDLPPPSIEHLETPGARAASSAGRWIDRPSHAYAADHTAPTSWRHPNAAPRSRPSDRVQVAPIMREPGERFVDYDEASDMPEGLELRRGMNVFHERFGKGEVLKIVSVGEPAVVAFFPGWGEKKVLARFLKLG
jgi:DNA helicase-2/ATP-dependent DNA helicase PcrA